MNAEAAEQVFLWVPSDVTINTKAAAQIVLSLRYEGTIEATLEEGAEEIFLCVLCVLCVPRTWSRQ